jgi:RHS repeat-associated protein
VGARLSAVVLPAVEDPEDGDKLAHPRYEYTYDDYGNLITITDKLKQDPNTNDVDANSARYTRFTYNELGQQTSRKLASGKVECKEYNALGQLIKSTDFKGQVTCYYYDDPNAPGRLSCQKFYHDANVGINDPNLIITAIHDKLGRRMRVDINDVDDETLAHYRWWYDEQGLVTTLESPQGFVAYEYHGNTGRQKSVRTPQQEADTKACYYYDQLGRLAEVEAEKLNGQDSNDVTYYTFNAVGSLETVTYPNGNVGEYTYNALNRLTNLTNWQSSAKQTPLSTYQYTLSPDGQRTKAIETTAAGSTEIAWTYDDLNRLVAEDYNAPGDVNDYGHEYVYDMVGNRLERNIVGNDPNTTYSYNDNDQLQWETTDGNTITYGYDDNGALILRDSNDGDDVTYSYDLRGRLAQADIENGPTVDYLYNPDGIRARATVDGNNIDYIIDPYNHTGYAQVLKEINGVSGTNRVYITGLDVVAQATGSTPPKCLLYDGHGSVRQLSNNVGNVVANYHYDAYGKALNFNPAQAATQLLYSGEWRDQQTGLYNNRARWYNPVTGRFNTMDPFAGSNRDPQSLHKYLYCHANPVNGSDPSGQLAIVGTLLNILSVVSIISTLVPFVLKSVQIGLGMKQLGALADFMIELNRAPFPDLITKLRTRNLVGQIAIDTIKRTVGLGLEIIKGALWLLAFSILLRATIGFLRSIKHARAVARAAKARGPITDPSRLLPDPTMQRGHIMPQEKWFERYWSRARIDIDEYTIYIERTTHLRGMHGRGMGKMPGRWNARWKAFFREHPGASARQIFQQAGKMMDEYGLSDYEIRHRRDW